MTTQWDVVIIGGGLAGLVAANYLAKSDMSICILEKNRIMGGRAKNNQIGRLASYSHVPVQVSAKVVLSHLKSNILGRVLYIDGGWQTIVDQLHNKAVLTEVKIQTHQSVKLIEQIELESFQITLSTEEQFCSKYSGS